MLLATTIEVVGAEVLIHGSVLEHVIDGGEDRGSDCNNCFLDAPSGSDAVELGLEVGAFRTHRAPGALHECGLEPGRAFAMRVDRRLPALSSLRGQMQAHEIRLASEGNWPMSMPISERIVRALRSFTPGIVLTCSTAVRKGSMLASTSRSSSAMTASRASI